jgi:hypothetical protein
VPRAAKEDVLLISADEVLGSDARERVPFAGLLAHEPELRDAQLPREEWQERLQAYLFPGPAPDAEPDDAMTEDPDAS